MKYHPDRNPGDAEAEASFKEASEAYEVLSDDDRRQRYDQFGHEGLRGTPGHDFGSMNAEDIFSMFQDIFGGGGGGFGGGGPRGDRGGYGGGRDRDQGPATIVDGSVKFYNAEKGYGFIAPDDGTPDVFVSGRVLERLGIPPLESNQRVRVSAREGQKGLVASSVELI